MPVQSKKQQKGLKRKKSSPSCQKLTSECYVLLDNIEPLKNVTNHSPKVNAGNEQPSEMYLPLNLEKVETESSAKSLCLEEEVVNKIICSPCKVVVDRISTKLIHVSKPLEKKTEFNYSFTDTSQTSLSSSAHSFTATNFYKGKPFNPLKKRLLSKKNILPHSDNVSAKPLVKAQSRKVMRSKKKVTSKAKMPPFKQESKNIVSHPFEEGLNNDEKENPILGSKFFTASRSVQQQEKVFTTALAWKKGVHVVKSGSTISVKSEPLVKKAVRHPRVRLVPISMQAEPRKKLKAVENVPVDAAEQVTVPETIEKEVEKRESKCIIIRLSPCKIPEKKVEPTAVPEDLHSNCDDNVITDAGPPCETAPCCNEAKDAAEADGDSKLYPMFRKGIQKKRRHEMTYSSTPKVVEKISLKPKHFFKETKSNDGKEQMIIDAGQKEIGGIQCRTCNMVYTVGDAKDEKMHQNFHEKYLTNLKFPGWKKEKVLGQYMDGRVIMINKQDRKHMLKKVEEIVYIVNRDLGFPDLGFPTKPNAMFLLFISNDRKVVGFLIAESVTQASRVVLDTSSENSGPYLPDRNIVASGATNFQKGIWCCGSETVKVVCGINRIWTAPSHRRQKIASRLIDCLRCNFIYGYVISTNEMAFSDPSLDGRAFAASYTGTPFFLVYK